MQFLRPIKLTPEQINLANLPPVGERLIKGSAGSGKTTVAIYRLITVAKTIRDDKRRTGDTSPVVCRLVTYNRTLRSYVEALIRHEQTSLEDMPEIQLCVSTFDKWAKDTCGIESNCLFYLSTNATNRSRSEEIVQASAGKNGLNSKVDPSVKTIMYRV